MKKVFLLATTAVFMTTANAWAEDPTPAIATDGQSATINVGATIEKAALITGVTDINFGTVYTTKNKVGDGDFGSLARFTGAGGEDDFQCEKFTDNPSNAAIACKGETSAGSYTISGTPASISIVGGEDGGIWKRINLSPSGNIYATVHLPYPTPAATEGKHYFNANLRRKQNTDLVDGDFGSKSASFTIQLGY